MAEIVKTSIKSLPLVYRGKVRDSYAVGEDKLLIVASDRISAFDVILDDPIPNKGKILTGLTDFWFKELDGIVSQLRVTKGTEVAVFMYETAVNQWKVSLRSKKSIDVSRTARYFGGGGHVRAAGFSMPGTFHDVVGNVARQLELQFDETEEA